MMSRQELKTEMGGTSNYFFLRCQTPHDLFLEDLSNDFHWVTNPVPEPWLYSNDVSKFDLTSSRCFSLCDIDFCFSVCLSSMHLMITNRRDRQL